MKNFWVVCLLTVLLLGYAFTSAADGGINFTTITVKEGLPSNTIYAIIKDRSGLIWFGTSNGLCKFDGTNFAIYRHEAGNPNSLPTNEVLCLYEDKTGKIWIGTGAGGLSYYDRAKDRIVPYLGDGSWAKLAHIYPRTIGQDHNGRLWIGTYGDLLTIDPATGKIAKIAFPKAAELHTESFVTLSFLEDSKGRIWIGTNNGLFEYVQGKISARFLNNPNDPESLSNNNVKSILEDKNGSIWIATLGGLNQLLADGRFRVFKHQASNLKSSGSDALFTMGLDRDNKIWIGTENGIDIFDPRSGIFKLLQPDPRNVFSLKSQSIRSIFIDPTEIYWIGTFGGGLAKYDKNLPLFKLKQSNPFDPSGLGSSFINSFAEYDPNSVFIGTDGAGLQLFNTKTGLFSRLEIKSNLRLNGGVGLTVWPLCIDHTGALWAGTYHDGLFRIDPRTGRYVQFVANGAAGALTSNDITSIIEDKKGVMWIGTLSGGVDIYDPAIGKFQQFSQVYHQQLPFNNFISCIIKSREGIIWMASVGTGIAAFDPATGSIRHYTKAANHLPDDIVDHLFLDKEGILWLSTASGMGRLDEKKQIVTTYTEKDGLTNNMVKNVLEDDAGILWITTDRGISSFNKQTGKFRNFDAENGVQQGSFSTGAGLKLSNGDIYFGGHDGFNYFNPKDLQAKPGLGPVLLTGLKVSNEFVTPGDNAPIKEQIAVAKQISLKYGLNFSIGYTALNYTAPLQNQFAYKLVGFDKDWNYVRQSRVANYTNIDPGTYTFEVKASNDGEHWSTAPATITITVLPPFWRTTYAYIIYVFLAGLFLFLLRRRGIQKIRNEFEIQREKMEIQQLMDRERHEAEQLHELDLLKIKFLTDLSHEFRTPISLILAPVEKLLQQKTNGEELEEVRMINRNARRLLNMVNQLLDFRKMEEQELSLKLEPGDVVAFIRETGDSFRDVAAKKQIALTFNSKCSSWKTTFDHNKLERIIFNLLSNAFKFTQKGGKVSLDVEMIEIPDARPHLIITITDTGVGIPKDEINRVFDRFYQHQTSTILNQGTGIGLSITKEFVEMHGGSIHAESEPGIGTAFIVDLPLLFVEENNTINVLPDEHLKETWPETTGQQAGEGNSFQQEELLANTMVADHSTTILLVEDNDEFRTYLAEHLRKYYQIVEANDGKQGWQKTLSLHPHLVVSDINMPVMTGIELSRKIKEDKRTCHIPVILLTAMAGEEEQLKGLRSGANDYLSKPFNFQILNTRIGNLLDLNKSVKDTYSKQIQLEVTDIVTESGNLKLLNSILKYIEDKLSDPDLSVEELSKHVGMSRGSLYYKLIELTGLSPIEYIRTVKLEKAAALLETSELNVTQIAYITGFGTPSYFTRMFKSKYGVVPSEYLNTKRSPAKQTIYLHVQHNAE